MGNIAFIDGQNLYLGTTTSQKPWKVNLKRFRIYLKDKYDVEYAYYFLGFIKDDLQDLYEEIQKAGFILKFRKHNHKMLGEKKGNVDSDIIFYVMKLLCKEPNAFNKIVLVSGDGDYKLLVDFLIAENRFEKILFPDRCRASSLYKKLGSEYFDDLGNLKSYFGETL